jgi:hypothetical protein
VYRSAADGILEKPVERITLWPGWSQFAFKTCLPPFAVTNQPNQTIKSMR